MAEKLFEEAIEKSGTKKKIQVFSAGISAMDGDRASENSVIACEEVGLDLSDHQSSSLTRATVENSSAIFCMTETHRALLNMYFEVPESSPIFLIVLVLRIVLILLTLVIIALLILLILVVVIIIISP